MKHFISRIRRFLVTSAIMLACSVLAMGTCLLAILTIDAMRVESYDEAYALVEIGHWVEDVEALLGRPYQCAEQGSDQRPIFVDPKHPFDMGYYPPGEYREQLIERGDLVAEYVDRIYEYRHQGVVRPFPVTWRIGVNSSGKVVFKHRDANGC